MSDKIHIVYGTDDNYIFPTTVSAASAVYYAGNRSNIVLHLFDAGVTDEHYAEYCRCIKQLDERVEMVRHKLSPNMFSGFGTWKGSVVTYSRMFMADLLPDVSWAIYVDGDTLWLGDPAELWNLRDDSKLVLASIDPPPVPGFEYAEADWYRRNGLEMDFTNYLCMGLMLANLKKMREENIPERCREFMQEHPEPRVVDQTCLNYVCAASKSPLPKNWGVFSAWHKGVDLTQPSIIHYCTDLPWRRDKINKLLSDVVLLWFAFCREVLGRDELLRLPLVDRIWRRFVFLVLKYNQWIVNVHPFVKSRLRNTHGIRKRDMAAILRKMKRKEAANAE